MVVHGVAAAVEGGTRARFQTRRRSIHSLATTPSHHRPQVLPVSSPSVARAPCRCNLRAVRAGREAPRNETSTPDATSPISHNYTCRQNSHPAHIPEGGGDAVPPRARPPPRNRTKPRRARLGSAGRARFREKK